MDIEIVCIGNELLSGKTLNTNATQIASILLKHGFKIDRVTTIGDEPDEMRRELTTALKRSKIVITTGGLGPTHDDLTRDIVAEIFQSPLKLDAAIKKDLIERFGPDLSSIEHQATIPTKAQIIPNKHGTASGYFFQEDLGQMIVLPGVPHQMEQMLCDHVLSHLDQQASLNRYHHKALYLYLFNENQVAPFLETLKSKYPEVELGICPSYGTLSIYLLSKNQESITVVAKEIEKQFQTYLYEAESGKIEEALHELFVSKKKTLALAESCSGGKMAARLTARAGSSDYFLGSVVSYSNQLKEKALGVSHATLEKHGAVSPETACEMVTGIIESTNADYGIAVTGIAGPTGGTQEKPVGTVWLAIGKKGEKPIVGQLPFKKWNSRTLIIEFTATYAFSNLCRYLSHNITPFSSL